MTESNRRWIASIVAVAAVVFGVFALGKPYWSLESMPVVLVIPALALVLWRGSRRDRAMFTAIELVIVVGLLIDNEFAVALLVYSAIAWLVVSGVRAIASFRKQGWTRVTFGVAALLAGIVALFWMDITSILLGLLIGPAMILLGIVALVRTWRPAATKRRSPGAPRPLSHALARIGAVVILVSAIAAAVATSVALSHAPQVDDFATYDGALGDRPGVLLKFEPFTREIPDSSIAWRILYTTTGLDNQITVATGLVISPADRESGEPLPVILWAHGTTGVEPQCAPTLLDDPLGSGAFDFAGRPLDAGWAIVAPDYLGLGTTAPHPYLVGKPTAHSSLDAVRAARQLESVSLSNDTVVWGHSQGGGAALWIGIEAPSYAPDVPLLGVAAMSPASDLPEFVDHALSTPAGPIFGAYIIWAYSNTYDDVMLNEYIRPGARFSQEKLVERCLSEPSIVASLVSALIREPFTRVDIREGELLNRLQENVVTSPIGVPLFLGQGEADSLVEPSVQAGYVKNLCGQSQAVEYHTYAGLDHLGVVHEDSPMIDDLMTWTLARFSGEPSASECSTTAHD